MRVGQLDRRIDLKDARTTKDDWNHPVRSYTHLATVWAHKQERTSVEVTESMQEVNVNRVIWTIRYRDDLSALDRIEYDSKHYYVTGIQELGRQEWLRIYTEQRDNDR